MMNNDEKSFRPSTEFDNEWLLERPEGLRPIQIPDNLEGMNEMMIAVREEILARLVKANPFGIELLPESPEETAEVRHQLNAAEWRAKHDK